MTPQEILVLICEKKQQVLSEVIGKEVNYFNEEDEKDLLSWSDIDAQKVLDKIIVNVDFSYFKDPLICPWCLLNDHRSCHKNGCSYGDRHGNCAISTKSDYRKILNILVLKTNDGIAVCTLESLADCTLESLADCTLESLADCTLESLAELLRELNLL